MTDFTKAPLDVIIPAIDQKRIELHMSYQALADSCDVSQTTIIRIIKRQVSPTYDVLQKMAAAVHFEPQADVVLPKDYTQEAYVSYLRELITRQRGDYERQILQQETQFNRIHAQNRRIILILAIALGVFAAIFIAFRAVDMVAGRELIEAMELCENCLSEIAEHSQFCAWCGHEQVSHLNM